MSLLYSQTNKQVQSLRNDIGTFRGIVESSNETALNKSLSLMGSISTTITNVGRLLSDFETYVSNQTDKAAQTKNRNRLTKLHGEYTELKKEFGELKNMRIERLKEQNIIRRDTDRNALFTPRSEDAALTSGVDENPFSVGYRSSKKHKDDPSDYDAMNMMSDQQMKMERSNAKLDEILDIGRHAFQEIVEQNEMILRAKEKMSESLLILGVSRQTVVQIEKVMWEDKVIFYLGAFFTLSIMWLIWKYLA